MAKKDEMLEAKRMLRVGFDFALGIMRAAAQGTTTFVDARQAKVKFPESASASVTNFLLSATESARDAMKGVARERTAQDEEDDKEAQIEALRKQIAAEDHGGAPTRVPPERSAEVPRPRRGTGQS
jgi:hypothetical protein